MKINNRILKLSLVVGLGLTRSLMADPCPENHCGSFMTDDDKRACLKENKDGKAFFKSPSTGKMCWCPCSCFANGTVIQGVKGDVTIESLIDGSEIASVSRNVSIAEVMKSTVENIKVLEFQLGNGRSIRVTGDHPMIVDGQIVREAKDVKVGDSLLDAKNHVVKVVGVSEVSFTGTLHNVVVKAEPGVVTDRIVVAEGVQTGDDRVLSYKAQSVANEQLKDIIKNIGNK